MKYPLIILFCIFTAFCLFDTGLFIYPSFTPYFSITIFSSFFLALLMIYSFVVRKTMDISLPVILMVCWSAYIVLHSLCVEKEVYRIGLMMGYTTFFLFCYGIFCNKLVSINVLLSIFLAGAIIQAVICLLQYFGLMGSFNLYFGVTGSIYNPNITAMYIAVCLPFCFFYLLPRKKLLAFLLISVLIVSLILLQCRTAFVGMVLTVIVFLLTRLKVREYILSLSLIYKTAGVLLLAASLSLAGIYLYEYKKESADGRVFIWKLSSQMIAENPVKGYGYGLFERNYNLYQADYFSSGNGSENEKTTAGHVNMAYNEYIQQFVEGGITGFVFYLAVLAAFLWIALKQKDREALSVFVMIIVMSFLNFIVQAIPVCIVLLVYASSLASKEKPIAINTRVSNSLTLIFLLFSSFLFYLQIGLGDAQYQLKQAITLNKSGEKDKAIEILHKNAGKAKTSEAYLRNLGKAQASEGKYEQAIFSLLTASRYTSSTDLYFSLSNCYIRMGEYEKAEQSLKTVSSMIPCNMRSRYYLMELYSNTGQQEKAVGMAEQIISIHPKVETKESKVYKEKANKLLDE